MKHKKHIYVYCHETLYKLSRVATVLTVLLFGGVMCCKCKAVSNDRRRVGGFHISLETGIYICYSVGCWGATKPKAFSGNTSSGLTGSRQTSGLQGQQSSSLQVLRRWWWIWLMLTKSSILSDHQFPEMWTSTKKMLFTLMPIAPFRYFILILI